MDSDTFAALAPIYHGAGVNVIPIVLGEKRPPKGVQWGMWQARRQTEAEVDRLVALHPIADVGVILGSRFADIETDGQAGEQALRDLRLPVPPTTTWRSPRGWHRLYRLDKPVASIIGLRDRLDVLAAGRYVVVPTSTGREWLTASGFAAAVPLPEEWRAHLTPARMTGATLMAAEQLGAPEGTRNVTLAALVGRWITQGMPEKTLRERAFTWAAQCTPPLDHKEAVGVIEGVLRTRERSRSPERDAILRSMSLGLGHPERSVYIALVALWGELGLSQPLLFAPTRMVSQYAGVSRDGVSVGVERLQQAGLIEATWGRDPQGRRTRVVRLRGIDSSITSQASRTKSYPQDSTNCLCPASRTVTDHHAPAARAPHAPAARAPASDASGEAAP